jgi:hypothetical protein
VVWVLVGNVFGVWWQGRDRHRQDLCCPWMAIRLQWQI